MLHMGGDLSLDVTAWKRPLDATAKEGTLYRSRRRTLFWGFEEFEEGVCRAESRVIEARLLSGSSKRVFAKRRRFRCGDWGRWLPTWIAEAVQS